MPSDTNIETFFGAYRELLPRLPESTIRAAEARIGADPGYYRRAARAGRLHVERLLVLLVTAGVDVGGFLSSATRSACRE